MDLVTAEGSPTYLTAGDGAQDVVFVHGWAATARYWLPLLELLPMQGYRYWALDLPGFGRSPALPVDPGRDHLVRLAYVIADFLDTHGLDNTVLGGHSMGGSVAMHTAFLSDRVGALILENVTPEPPRGVSREARIRQLRTSGLTMELLDQGMRHWYHRLTGEQRRELDAEALPSDVDTLIATQIAVRRGVPEHVVDAISGPIMLIHGREDAQRDLASAISFQQRLPGAELTVIDDAGHTPHYERPAAVAAALTLFLARLPQPEQRSH